LHAFLRGVGNTTLRARLVGNFSLELFHTLLDLGPEEVEDLIANVDGLNALFLSLSLDLSNWDAEGADKGLGEAHEDVVVAVAG